MFENVHYMTLLEEGTPKSTEYAEKATFPICKKVKKMNGLSNHTRCNVVKLEFSKKNCNGHPKRLKNCSIRRELSLFFGVSSRGTRSLNISALVFFFFVGHWTDRILMAQNWSCLPCGLSVHLNACQYWHFFVEESSDNNVAKNVCLSLEKTSLASSSSWEKC